MVKDTKNKLSIYLARHGQDLDNASGILNGQRDMPLSDRGEKQAEELADKISGSGITFDHIYSSPLQRARKTAEIIAQKSNMRVDVLPLLIERNYGVMTGQVQSRIEELCAPNILKTDTVTYFLNPAGGETFPDLIGRAKKLLTFLNSRHSDGNILLVAHGDFGKMIYAAYYGLKWEDVLRNFHFGNSDLLRMSPDSDPEDSHVFKFKQFNV